MVSVLTLAVNVPSAPAEGVTVLMLCTSLRSTSLNAIVPLSVRLPAGVTSSVTPPLTSVAATTGSSFVPAMSTLTVRVTMPPWPGWARPGGAPPRTA